MTKIVTTTPINNILDKAKRANSRSKKALGVFNSIIKSIKVLKSIR
jgi:hypothetical protein